ncbi:MAG: DUF3667 domain-containing protein, partial [Candidatus Didemnitutus sp.]|nr:DUF3667 domain-containing protein [Candidatus Didemnitutus sp.]
MPKPTVPCVSCGAPTEGQFCAQCGEKRVGPGDLTLRHFVEHMLEAFTHADGKIFLTVRLLLARPGRITADYLRGKRKPY